MPERLKAPAVAPTKPRPGRPRDKTIDRRIMEASLNCYSRVGWSSFTFEAVAREAGVGKPALYLRWNSREALLAASFSELSLPFMAHDRGSLADDLRDWMASLYRFWDSTVGLTFARLQVEYHFHAELSSIYFEVSGRLARAAREIIHRAIDRGELSPKVRVNLALEVVNGAVFSRLTNIPHRFKSRSLSNFDQLSDALIRMITEHGDIFV